MNRTNIETVVNRDGTQGFTWNPITGCNRGCSYCYARETAKRNPTLWNNFEVMFHENRILGPRHRRKPSTIFVGSMTDLFAPWVNEQWKERVLEEMTFAHWHTYLLLTKGRYPEGIPCFGNWWFGFTVDTRERAQEIPLAFANLRYGAHTYLSVEPILDDVADLIDLKRIDWLIIGAQTGENPVVPKRQWIENLVSLAHEWHVPVYAKESLSLVYPDCALYKSLPYLETR